MASSGAALATHSPDWCVALHLATPANWPYIKSELLKIQHVRFDLYVNIVQGFKWTEEEITVVESEIVQSFKHCCERIVTRRMPNVGMDIGGFFNSLVDIYESGRQYQFVFKIHSKSNLTWLKMLLGTLVASFDLCDTLYKADTSIGQFSASSWLFASPDSCDYGCFDVAMTYLDTLKYPRLDKQQYGFTAGTLFTMRMSILTNWIRRIGAGSNSNPVASLSEHLSGSLKVAKDQKHDHAYEPWLHCVERLFGILVTRSGYSIRGLFSTEHERMSTHTEHHLGNVFVDKALITAPLTELDAASKSTYTATDFDVISYVMDNADIYAHAFDTVHASSPLDTANRHWLTGGRFEPNRVRPATLQR